MLKNEQSNKPRQVRMAVQPTAERLFQNGGLRLERYSHHNMAINRYRAVWECPLDAYRDGKIIDESEFRAGLRFRRAYYGAVISRKNEPRLMEGVVGDSVTKADKTLKEAYEALPPETTNVVIDVCGHSQHTYSPQALEKLRKGLGKLAILWHSAAIEVCEVKKHQD